MTVRPAAGGVTLNVDPTAGGSLSSLVIGARERLITRPDPSAWADLELTIEARPLRSVVVHATPAAVCVEPQTAWPDAIRLDGSGTDTGLVALSAGESFVAETRWSWRELIRGRGPAADDPIQPS